MPISLTFTVKTEQMNAVCAYGDIIQRPAMMAEIGRKMPFGGKAAIISLVGMSGRG